jgi:hypothetical protein
VKRIALVAPLLLLALACPVHAAPQLRLGGDYVLDGGPGIFSLALGLDTPLARAISVGGRFGMLVSTSPTTAGVPLDVFLRVHAGRFYFEGMGGPWIFFKGDTVQGHAGFGFGIVTRTLEFGGEVGWLSGFSSATIGGRLAFRI